MCDQGRFRGISPISSEILPDSEAIALGIVEPRQYGTGDGGDKGVDTEQTGVINPMFAQKMSLPIQQFDYVVESFCEWVEGEEHEIIDARQHLIALITIIPHLESFRESTDELKGSSFDELKPREETHKRFSDLPFQYYRSVFDPLNLGSTEEIVTGDLHDDLADIYRDLRKGLELHRNGSGVRRALSFWVDSYFSHWGHHALSALSAIDAFYRHEPNRSEQGSDGQA